MSTANPSGHDVRLQRQFSAGEAVEHDDQVSPLPGGSAYDPTAVLDNFQALHISDQGRTPMAMANPIDPVPRSASAMSSRSLQSQRLRQPAMTHPQSGRYSGGDQLPPSYDAESVYDTVYSGDPASVYGTAYTDTPDSVAYPQRPWDQPPPTDQFNPLYAAASNVLGMGPPPGVTPPPMAQGPALNGYPASQMAFAQSQTSLSSSHSAPYADTRSLYSSQHSHPGPSATPVPSIPQDDMEFERRPSFSRGDTSMSVSLASQKTKAVDLSAPPYTKQYIDQYRQRIKGDPDPEAHFLYAKYLVDAARKIRATAKDQRSAKKYTEVLITEALKVFRRLATQGETYSEAQFYLANCHGTGALGLQVDHERAYHLYLQAAKQNHPAACYRVAVCNEIGVGTRSEPPRAAAFYRKAASLGDTAAMFKLGTILLNGALGEPKNPREAVGWLRRAAEQADEENPHALHELALLHENPQSQIVPYDPILAKNLLIQAAQLGYTQSQYKLGQCYEYGTLTCPVDPRRSIAWYTKAAEKGDAEAELALSGWYLTGSEGVLKQSDSEAYLWARRAANKGLSKAEYAVGYYAEVGIGVHKDIEIAKRWYMRAAGTSTFQSLVRCS